MHFPTLEPLSLFSQYKGRINVPLYRTELNRVGRPTCLVLFARGQKTLLCKDAGTVGEKNKSTEIPCRSPHSWVRKELRSKKNMSEGIIQGS